MFRSYLIHVDLMCVNIGLEGTLMQRAKDTMLTGDKIALIRKAAGLSQEACSQRLGISRSAFQHYERNEHDVPASVIKRFCDEFGIDSTWLLFDDGDARIAERNQSICQITRFILEFVEDRASAAGKALSKSKKWEVVDFIASDFWSENSAPENVAKEIKEKVDNIIYLIAA